MARKKNAASLGQQDLLRRAMEDLGMTRAEFAVRISVPVRTLDKWLLPSDSSDKRVMTDMGRAYILEILEWHKKSA